MQQRRLLPCVRMLTALALLVHVAMAPMAAAADADGRLLGSGPILVDGEGTAGGVLLGVFVADGKGLARFDATSPLAHVTRFDARYAEIASPAGILGTRVSLSKATFDLHDVEISLADGGGDGWIGISPERAYAQAGASARGAWTPTAPGALGDEQTQESPDSPSFRQEIGTRAFARTLEDAIVTGAASVKWSGLTLDVSARENSSQWWSGRRTSGEPGGVREQTWFILTFDDARITLDGRAPIETRLGDLAIDNASTIGFRYHDGDLSSAAITLTGQPGEEAVITGRFDAAFLALDEGPVDFSVEISGEIRSSSLVPSAPLTNGVARSLSWLAIIAAAAVAGGAGLWIGARPRERLAADEWSALAGIAAEEGRYEDAIGLVANARARAPTSIRLALEEAYYHELCGRPEEALIIFTKLAPSDDTGEADLQAARLCLDRNVDVSSAREHLREALRKSPALLLEVESDAVFEDLVHDPLLVDRLRHARREVGEEP